MPLISWVISVQRPQRRCHCDASKREVVLRTHNFLVLLSSTCHAHRFFMYSVPPSRKLSTTALSLSVHPLLKLWRRPAAPQVVSCTKCIYQVHLALTLLLSLGRWSCRNLTREFSRKPIRHHKVVIETSFHSSKLGVAFESILSLTRDWLSSFHVRQLQLSSVKDIDEFWH